MGVIMEVATLDSDGTIKVLHRFYGKTREEATGYFGEHLDTCSYLEGNTEEGGSFERYFDGEPPALEELQGARWSQIDLVDEDEGESEGESDESEEDNEEEEEA